MKSAVVIPTYWSTSERLGTPGGVQCYDHATPIDAENPQLNACLGSLARTAGLGTVVILVVAPPDVEQRAVRRVHEIVLNHPALEDVVIVDSFKAMAAATKIGQIVPPGMGEPVSLRGYGAIRNMGLLTCCALGCDVAVFLDDDETVLDENFLLNAVYGMGAVSRQGLPVMAKSGYFLDRRNSALADRRKAEPYNKHWAKRAEFNEWMTQALAGPRISRSNTLCGGCFAVHAEAFTRVCFDPWITRGEDLDYLFDLRMYGVDVWFDNKWRVRHNPPRVKDTASRFLQDVYRWTYERRKIEVCNSNIDLQKLAPESFMPYPGPWIGPELPARIRKTAYWRALMTPEHGAYWEIYRKGRKDAVAYAEEHCTKYLDFQPYWHEITESLWMDDELARVLKSPGMLNDGIAERMARRAGQMGLGGQACAGEQVVGGPVPVAAVVAGEPAPLADEPAEGTDAAMWGAPDAWVPAEQPAWGDADPDAWGGPRPGEEGHAAFAGEPERDEWGEPLPGRAQAAAPVPGDAEAEARAMLEQLAAHAYEPRDLEAEAAADEPEAAATPEPAAAPEAAATPEPEAEDDGWPSAPGFEPVRRPAKAQAQAAAEDAEAGGDDGLDAVFASASEVLSGLMHDPAFVASASGAGLPAEGAAVASAEAAGADAGFAAGHDDAPTSAEPDAAVAGFAADSGEAARSESNAAVAPDEAPESAATDDELGADHVADPSRAARVEPGAAGEGAAADEPGPAAREPRA